MTKKELRAELTKRGVIFNKRDTNKVLEDLIADSDHQRVDGNDTELFIKKDEVVITGDDVKEEIAKPEIVYLSSPNKFNDGKYRFKTFDRSRHLIEELTFTSMEKAVIEFNRLSK